MLKKLQILPLILLSIFTRAESVTTCNAMQLRIFPELREKQITEISVIDSSKAVAVGRKALFKWDGKKWQEFTPPFPLDRIYLDYLKAFSFQNIWLFVRLAEGYYRSLIYHFNGAAWEYIPSPQPYELSSVALIDSVSFYATGGYGNLIYYDGITATNLSNPGGRNAKIAKVFSPSHFLIWTQEDNNATNHFYRLNEYNHGAWRAKDSLSMEAVIYSYFISSDSGYFTNQDNRLYKYARNQFSIIEKFPRQPSGPYANGLLYYCDADFALCSYDIITGKRKRIAEAPLECAVFPLSQSEFLLLGGDKNVYYLGDRNYGQAFKKARIAFRHYNISKAPSNHIGIASYRNKHNLIDLYFTNIYEKNSFFTFTFDSTPPGIKLNDILSERGLLGLGVKRIPEDSLDHGCFFADIDNDGDMDAVCAPIRGPAVLYENVGDDCFEDITDEIHFELFGRLESIWLNDLNGDGRLDIVAGDYLGAISILINRGQFRFKEVALLAGIPSKLRNRLVALADVDNDGDQDLFLFNDSQPIRYFENQGIQDSTKLPLFEDASFCSPQLTSRFDFFTQSMAFGDYDNDGDLDLFLANRRSPLKLFQNDGFGNFVDVSGEMGFNQSVLAFGANWGDLDQDSHLDLFLATLGKNYIFWNDQGRYFAMDSTSLLFNDEASSTGSILEDLEADGDLDIAVACSEISNSKIYRSQLDRRNFIRLQLQGTRSNRDGIGGRIWFMKAAMPTIPII